MLFNSDYAYIDKNTNHNDENNTNNGLSGSGSGSGGGGSGLPKSVSMQRDDFKFASAIIGAMEKTDWQFVETIYVKNLSSALEAENWSFANNLLKSLRKYAPPRFSEEHLDELIWGIEKALLSEKRDTLRMLLEIGLGRPQDLLSFAVKKELDPRTLELLFKFGANPNGGGGNNFVTAIRRGDLATVRTFLRAGADVNLSKGKPLREAVKQGHVEIVALLLRCRADLDSVVRSRSRRQLWGRYRYARGSKRRRQVWKWIERPSSFQLAYDRHDWEMLRVLIRGGADPILLKPPLPEEFVSILSKDPEGNDDNDDTEHGD